VRILIVEDDRGQQMVYRLWFEDHPPDICDSVERARKLLEENRYDAVIIDLYLKEDETGLRLIEEMARKRERPRIVIVSAYTDKLREMFPVKLEGVSWLSKEEATRERLMRELGLT